MVYNRKQFRYSIEILASDGLDLGIIRINIKNEIEFDKIDEVFQYISTEYTEIKNMSLSTTTQHKCLDCSNSYTF